MQSLKADNKKSNQFYHLKKFTKITRNLYLLIISTTLNLNFLKENFVSFDTINASASQFTLMDKKK